MRNTLKTILRTLDLFFTAVSTLFVNLIDKCLPLYSTNKFINILKVVLHTPETAITINGLFFYIVDSVFNISPTGLFLFWLNIVVYLCRGFIKKS